MSVPSSELAPPAHSLGECVPPLELGRQHSIAGEGAGRTNSDYRGESLALCLLCAQDNKMHQQIMIGAVSATGPQKNVDSWSFSLFPTSDISGWKITLNIFSFFKLNFNHHSSCVAHIKYLRQILHITRKKWRQVDLNPFLYSKTALLSYKVGGTLPAQYGKRNHQAERRAALWAYEGPSGTYSQPVQVQNTLPRHHRTHLQEKYSTDTIREGDSDEQDRETTWVHSRSDLSCHAGF